MIVSLEYSNGYHDALMDIYNWFSSKGERFNIWRDMSIKRDSIIKLLETFVKYTDRFMSVKSEFNLNVHLKKEKGKIKIEKIVPAESELREKLDEADMLNMLKKDNELFFQITGDKVYKEYADELAHEELIVRGSTRC